MLKGVDWDLLSLSCLFLALLSLHRYDRVRQEAFRVRRDGYNNSRTKLSGQWLVLD